MLSNFSATTQGIQQKKDTFSNNFLLKIKLVLKTKNIP